MKGMEPIEATGDLHFEIDHTAGTAKVQQDLPIRTPDGKVVGNAKVTLAFKVLDDALINQFGPDAKDERL
jgi:hypothetical protein